MNRREAYFEFSKILINDNDSKQSYVHKTKYKDLIVKIYDDFEKKNTIDVKITDLELFKDLINLLKENIDSLPTELKDKISEIINN